jgi:hypothetical protein
MLIESKRKAVWGEKWETTWCVTYWGWRDGDIRMHFRWHRDSLHGFSIEDSAMGCRIMQAVDWELYAD